MDKIRNEAPFRIERENNEPSNALYAWVLLDGGQVISVSNRNELIQKLKFSQPFNIAKANQDVWITQTHQTNSATISVRSSGIITNEVFDGQIDWNEGYWHSKQNTSGQLP